ncbi:MAG: GGDEF domain-containing protein [Spirochaetales bacterium]|nr:GGDEF domain-containing protein [Spirochaetales bacterium]
MMRLPSHYVEMPVLHIRFRRPPRPLSLLVVAVLVGLVGFIDYLTGTEMEFSIFYLIPITTAVFLSGWIVGAAASAACFAVSFAFDYLSGDQDRSFLLIFSANLAHLGYFTLHTLIISWLLRVIREVRALSLHDPLTTAANWRYFEEQAAMRLKIARRNRAPVTIAYIDLDNFKKVNDTLGHHVGNEVLKTVADSIQSQIRPNDLLARLGGDEFGLLIDDPRSDEIRGVLERVMDETCGRLRERNWPVTLSLGAVTYRRLPDSITTMVKEADRLMYRVKKSGKNRMLYAVRR